MQKDLNIPKSFRGATFLKHPVYVTPGSLSDGGIRFQIRAAAQGKHRSPKRVDVQWSYAIRQHVSIRSGTAGCL